MIRECHGDSRSKKTKDEMILLCEKMYCESDITEDLNFHETYKIVII